MLIPRWSSRASVADDGISVPYDFDGITELTFSHGSNSMGFKLVAVTMYPTKHHTCYVLDERPFTPTPKGWYFYNDLGNSGGNLVYVGSSFDPTWSGMQKALTFVYMSTQPPVSASECW